MWTSLLLSVARLTFITCRVKQRLDWKSGVLTWLFVTRKTSTCFPSKQLRACFTAQRSVTTQAVQAWSSETTGCQTSLSLSAVSYTLQNWDRVKGVGIRWTTTQITTEAKFANGVAGWINLQNSSFYINSTWKRNKEKRLLCPVPQQNR